MARIPGGRLIVGVGTWMVGYSSLVLLGSYNHLRRRDGMPVLVFEEAEDEEGYRFRVAQGKVAGVFEGGTVRLVCVEHAMRFLENIPGDQMHRGDKLFLAMLVSFSRLPRGVRAHNTSGFPA